MKAIKLLCLLMALAMVLGMGLFFVGCSDNDPENDPPPPPDNDPDNDPVIREDWYRDLDFGGQEIRFLSQFNDLQFAVFNDGVTRVDTITRSIAVDPGDDQASRINMAVAARNSHVETQLGVRIVAAAREAMTSYVSGLFVTGIDDYDVFQLANFHNITLLLHENGRGHFLDLNMIAPVDLNGDVSQGENFLQVNQPWWDYDRYEKMTYNGRAFFVTGHLSQSWVAGMYVTFVNSVLWEANSAHVQAITGGETNIHQIVRDGGWHLDFIIELSNRMYANVSGTDDITENDIVGFMIHRQSVAVNMIPQALASAAGVHYVEVDRGGNWRLALNDVGSPAAAFAMTNYRLHYHSNALQVGPATTDRSTHILSIFTQGNALMTIDQLHMIEGYLRAMEDAFYILPLPMLNAEQFDDLGYQSFVHPTVGIFTIPTQARSNARAITATLELMAQLSYRDVTDVYLHQSLAGLFNPGQYEDAIAMINLGREGIDICQGIIWPAQFSDGTAGPYQFFRNNISISSPANLVSTANVTRWQTLIQAHGVRVNEATDDEHFAPN